MASLNQIVIACLLVTACASTSAAKFDPSKLSELHTGKTTYSEVVIKFGEPDFDHTKLSGERLILYYYGGSAPSTSITKTVMATFTDQVDPKQTSEEMKFNADGVLTKLEMFQPKKLN